MERDRFAITVKRGTSSRIALKLLSCPQVHVQSAKDHTGGETAPRGVGPRGWTLKVPTKAPILITPEKPQGLITVGSQSVNFLLDSRATYSAY